MSKNLYKIFLCVGLLSGCSQTTFTPNEAEVQNSIILCSSEMLDFDSVRYQYKGVNTLDYKLGEQWKKAEVDRIKTDLISKWNKNQAVTTVQSLLEELGLSNAYLDVSQDTDTLLITITDPVSFERIKVSLVYKEATEHPISISSEVDNVNISTLLVSHSIMLSVLNNEDIDEFVQEVVKAESGILALDNGLKNYVEYTHIDSQETLAIYLDDIASLYPATSNTQNACPTNIFNMKFKYGYTPAIETWDGWQSNVNEGRKMLIRQMGPTAVKSSFQGILDASEETATEILQKSGILPEDKSLYDIGATWYQVPCFNFKGAERSYVMVVGGADLAMWIGKTKDGNYQGFLSYTIYQ